MNIRRIIIRSSLVAIALLVSPVVVILALAALPPEIEQGSRTRAWIVDAEYLGRSGVRMQRNRNDCGVAALEMLVEHAGGNVSSLVGWHEAVSERGAGMTLLEMRKSATAAGIETRGLRADIAGLRRITLPAILHFDRHYVVLDSIGDTGEYLLRDPANGRMRMSTDAFREAWTGEVLALATPRDSAPARATSKAMTAALPPVNSPLADTTSPGLARGTR